LRKKNILSGSSKGKRLKEKNGVGKKPEGTTKYRTSPPGAPSCSRRKSRGKDKKKTFLKRPKTRCNQKIRFREKRKKAQKTETLTGN